MEPNYDIFLQKNNIVLNRFQKTVSFVDFSKANPETIEDLIDALAVDGIFIELAKQLNIAAVNDSRNLFARIQSTELTTYKVASVMALMGLNIAKEFSEELAMNYQTVNDTIACYPNPSKSIEKFLKDNHIKLTQHQRKVSWKKYLKRESNCLDLITLLAEGNEWQKIAEIFEPTTLCFENTPEGSRMFVAMTITKTVTLYKIIQIALKCNLQCVKALCQKLESFQADEEDPLPAAIYEKSEILASTSTTSAVANQVIMDQMKLLQDQAARQKQLEEELARLRISAAVQVPAAAGPAQPVAESSGDCVICQDAQANTVVVDCGHLAMCKACSGSVKNCPMCRMDITKLIQIFKAS